MKLIKDAGPRDEACVRKVAYRRFHSAVWFARKSMAYRPETQLYAYRCPLCRLWHLTSHPGLTAIRIERKEERTTHPA